MTDRKTAVAYLRVSTKNQGASGLGIDAQRNSVAAYCRANKYELIDEFCEVESGRRSSRPNLKLAMARAKGTRSLLVIARLDRLSRSARFIHELLDDERLKFVACDTPDADRFVLGILANIAEKEAIATSIATKAAMAAAKRERGAVFGNPANLPAGACYRGARASIQTRRRRRDETVADVLPRMRDLRMQGYGYNVIARVLNDEDYKTALGNRWRGNAVWRALTRELERRRQASSLTLSER